MVPGQAPVGRTVSSWWKQRGRVRWASSLPATALSSSSRPITRRVRTSTEAFGVNLFVPERWPVDRSRVLAYRDLIAPVAERVGVELRAPRWDDDDHWNAKVDLLSASPVPWVSFTYGLPDPRYRFALTTIWTRLLLMTVTSQGEARLAVDLAPDGLVVQSADAGGRRGVFDQHRAPGMEPLPDLVASIRAATGLPVIAAGGLATPEQVAEVLNAGAEAAQVGTALLLADEAGSRPTHRRAIADTSSTTTLMRAFTGRVARDITNAFSRRFDAAAPAGYPAIHHMGAPFAGVTCRSRRYPVMPRSVRWQDSLI